LSDNRIVKMKRIFFLLVVCLSSFSCTYEKAEAPQPLRDCVPDVIKHLRTVSMQDNFFSPLELELIEGDTVKWVENGAIPHTATCDGTNGTSMPQGASGFDTGILASSGDSYKQVINTPGTYRYICIIHGSSMMGTLIVKKRCQ